MHKKKPEIVHFIFNLGRGGAETLIVRVTERMEDYEHTIVTLFDVNHFKDELRNIRYISLKLKLYHLLFFPFIAVRFRKLMRTLKPDIVHAHLLWPVVIARMAVPKNIPLITKPDPRITPKGKAYAPTKKLTPKQTVIETMKGEITRT